MKGGTESSSDTLASAYIRRNAILMCLPVEIRALGHVANRIDEMLTTPEERILEAATLGRTDRLYKLWDSFSEIFYKPIPAGVDWKNVPMVDLFKSLIVPNDIDLSDATEAAAQRGHFKAVKVLLSSRRRNASPYWVMRKKALLAAAANGHLDIVEYVEEYRDYTGRGYEVSLSAVEEALFRAIAGGHAIVVEYLLESDLLECGFEEPLLQALGQRQEDVIDVIYTAYYDSV